MINIAIGLWAVMPGYSGRLFASKYDLVQITKVTDKQIKGKGGESHARRLPKEAVMATFETKEEALHLISKIAGIRGERHRRIKAAQQTANDALDKLLSTPTS